MSFQFALFQQFLRNLHELLSKFEIIRYRGEGIGAFVEGFIEDGVHECGGDGEVVAGRFDGEDGAVGSWGGGGHGGGADGGGGFEGDGVPGVG